MNIFERRHGQVETIPLVGVRYYAIIGYFKEIVLDDWLPNIKIYLETQKAVKIKGWDEVQKNNPDYKFDQKKIAHEIKYEFTDELGPPVKRWGPQLYEMLQNILRHSF